jgi:hypothetical protein
VSSVKHSRVLKNDRPDRGFAAPIGERLILLAGCPQGVEGRGPACVSLCTTVERREVPDWSARVVSRLLKWLGSEEFEGARQRRSKRRCLEARPSPGGREQVLAARDLLLQVFLAFTRLLELLLGNALLLRVEVRPLDLARQLLGIAVPDALTQTSLDVVVDDF